MLLHTRLAAGVLAGALSLTACNGGGGSNEVSLTPDKALAQAKNTLDDTSGVTLALTTDDLPDGVTGVEKAEGVGTHAPAFEGSITVNLVGQAIAVPVVAVDGKVYAQLPFTQGYQDVDPGEYGAPDPALLMTPDKGFSAVLGATTDLEAGDSVRGGEGNKEVLTTYTGGVAGSAMTNIIPTATGDFDATYTIADDGELRTARFTGVFYPDSESMTYTVTFDDYGTDKDITKP